MRHTPRVPTPRRFQALVDSHPGADWKLIDSAAKEEIQAALLPAQDYVCAYCERPLRWAGGPFRETPEKTEHLVSTLHIEHFHPQNPDSNVPCMIHPSDYSPHLDWENLLAVCDGNKGDCCDGKLSNPTLARCGQLLHPSDLAEGRWFTCNAKGEIEVARSCPDPVRAELTKNLLGLNCKRLVRLRENARKTAAGELKRLREASYPRAVIAPMLRHEMRKHGLYTTIDSVLS